MTKKYLIFIGFLIICCMIHYLNILDLKIFSFIATVVIAIFCIGGNHSAMRTYSSMDIKNIEYDAKPKNGELSLEALLKLIIPIVIYLILIFSK